MKIHGVSIAPPKPVEIKIFRPNGERIVLYAAPIMDISQFDEICPRPVAPLVTVPGKGSYNDEKHPKFREKMSKWMDQKVNYIVIKSLSDGTTGLEWEKVNLNDPDTWKYLDDDLTECFSEGERTQIINATLAANSPSEDTEKEALDRFTQPQEEVADPSSSQ